MRAAPTAPFTTLLAGLVDDLKIIMVDADVDAYKIRSRRKGTLRIPDEAIMLYLDECGQPRAAGMVG